MPFVTLIAAGGAISEALLPGYTRSYNVPTAMGNSLTEVIVPRQTVMVCVKDTIGRTVVYLALTPVAEGDPRPLRSVCIGELALSNARTVELGVGSKDDSEALPDKLYASVGAGLPVSEVRPFAARNPVSGEYVSLSVPRGVEVDDVELWCPDPAALPPTLTLRAEEGGTAVPVSVLWAASPDPSCLLLNDLMVTCDRSRRLNFVARPGFPEGCALHVVGRIVVPLGDVHL